MGMLLVHLAVMSKLSFFSLNTNIKVNDFLLGCLLGQKTESLHLQNEIGLLVQSKTETLDFDAHPKQKQACKTF